MASYPLRHCKDRGASIEAVSRALRRKHNKTIETFYGRIRADHAFAEIERALSGPRDTQRERRAPVGERTDCRC